MRRTRRRSPRTSSTRREILSWVTTVLLAVALFGGIRLAGLSLVVVTTDSMEPTLMPRDYVLTVSPRLVTPRVGSIVVFTPTFGGSQLPAHIHRLVGVNPDGSWQTRGDNANGKDPWSVTSAQVKGVSTGIVVPETLTRSPWTIGAGAFLIALLALWPSRRPDEAADPGQAGDPALE